MIRARRNNVAKPEDLDRLYSKDRKTELERATDAFNEDTLKSYEFSRYKLASVKSALDQLFHGKCAYCESDYSSTQPVDVEHFRPKGKVDGDDSHPGYWWLAGAWDNLLPSCIDCNRRRHQEVVTAQDIRDANFLSNSLLDRTSKLSVGKGCAFPLAEGSTRGQGPLKNVAMGRLESYTSDEVPLLIDPSRDNPADDIDFHVGARELNFALDLNDRADRLVALVLPRLIGNEASERGLVSIEVYGLNRLGLVQARVRLLRELEFLQNMFIALADLQVDILDHQNQNAAQLPQNTSDLLARVSNRVGGFQSDIKARFRSLQDERSPYSAFVTAWIKAYIAG